MKWITATFPELHIHGVAKFEDGVFRSTDPQVIARMAPWVGRYGVTQVSEDTDPPDLPLRDPWPGAVLDIELFGEDGKVRESVLPPRLSDVELRAASVAAVQDAIEDGTIAVSASGISATQGLLARLKRGVQDASILVIGDSTGNDPTDWPRVLAGMLGTDWPTHTVTHRLWDDATKAYAAPTTVQTGSGARTLAIYNCSVAGWKFDGVLGERFTAAVETPQANLVIINLGHNESTGVGVDFPGAFRGRLLSLTEAVAVANPAADIALILQNPATDNTNMAYRADVLTTVATERGFGIIDVHQHFIDAGIPAAWYADNVHPNATGSQEWANVVHEHFTYSPSAATLPRQVPPLLSVGQNMLANPTFSAWAAAPPLPPDSWTATGANVTKDTTAGNFETGTYGLRIASAGAAQAYIRQPLSPTQLAAVKGSWVTLAARVKLGPSGTATTSRIALGVTGGVSVTTPGPVLGLNGWRWLIACAFVPQTATAVAANIYADTGTSGAGDTLVDRVLLVRGTLPRDVALI